jgi:hypothetical protein
MIRTGGVTAGRTGGYDRRLASLRPTTAGWAYAELGAATFPDRAVVWDLNGTPG